MRGIFTSGRVALALSAIALFCAVGGGAYAATRHTKMITVCVKHSGGELYRANKCDKGDKGLSWNRTGKVGARGARGATGATGATGPAGAPGVAGPGAQTISTVANVGSTATGTIAGTWNYTVACAPPPSGTNDMVTFNLNGPGTVASTTLIPATPPQVQVSPEEAANDSLSFQGGPVDQTLFLQNGATAVQVQLIVTGSSPCSVVGSAIPLGS